MELPSALLIFTLSALCPILSLASGPDIEVERKLVTMEPPMGVITWSAARCRPSSDAGCCL